MSRSWGPERAECERIDAWFEDYLDGELDSAQCSELDAHVSTCPSCRQELALARSVVDGLRALPAIARPTSSAANRTGRDLQGGAGASRTTAEHGAIGAPSTRAWRSPTTAPTSEGSTRSKRSPWGHPLLQAAALLLMLSAVWLAMGDRPFGPSFQMDRPTATVPGGDDFSEAEIREAEEDLRVALAYFGGLAEKAGWVVRDQVLAERVVEPTRRAFSRIQDFGADVGAPSASATSSEDTSQEKERP